MRVRSLLLLTAFLGFTALSGDAAADILTIRQEVVSPGSGDRVEVTTFMTETAADRAEVIARLKKSLAEDTEKNPNLAVGFEEVAEEKTRSPSSAKNQVREALEKVAGERPIVSRSIPESVRKALHFQYPDWFLNKSRWVFSISRGSVNASIATWSLMASQHLPFPVAVAAGVLTGAMSGSLQFMNEKVQKFLTNSIAEKWVKAKNLREGVKTVEGLFRWYLLEIGFVTTVQVALTALGHPPTGPLEHDIVKTLTTALSAVAAQGTWDYAVGKMTQKSLAIAKTARAKKIARFRGDFITMGLSALAITGMVGQLSGMSFGDTLFTSMGVTGAIYLGKILYTDWKCAKLLKQASPPSPPNPLTKPADGSVEVDVTSSAERPLERFAVEFAFPA